MITYQVGNAAPVRRSGMVTAASMSDGTSLRAGVSVPVPTTTYQPAVPAKAAEGQEAAASDGGRPVTSFQYRSVGLNVDLRQAVVAGNRIQLRGLAVEFSALDEKASDTHQMPAFPTFSQRFNLVLESDRQLLVAQSSDFVDNVERKQSVEVRATILR